MEQLQLKAPNKYEVSEPGRLLGATRLPQLGQISFNVFPAAGLLTLLILAV
jgi:hypothetical protein